MNWLAQNAWWVVAAMAIAWFVARSGFGRRSHASGDRRDGALEPLNQQGSLNSIGHHSGGFGGLLDKLGHAGHGGDAGDDRGDAQPGGAGANVPEAALDPVSGEAVSTARALTSVYEGRIYFFASKENRERFEAAPQEFFQRTSGHPMQRAETAYERPHRRGGC
ncbi:MAG: YHS domain-containing protein [Proteobacteria bacterium]|jgi:YHS domain-containing protein|nr:YHS domain-containing protein [Pseudomonadota bacterium]